jgi:hypothetical protein
MLRRTGLISVCAIMVIALSSCKNFREKFHPSGSEGKTVNVATKADSSEVKVPPKHVSDSFSKAIAKKKAFEKALTDSLMNIGDGKNSDIKSGGHYYIIVGSFANPENAKETAVKYSAKGFKTELIRMSKNRGADQYLVSVRDFSDYNKASVYLKDFKANGQAGAWIYTGK